MSPPRMLVVWCPDWPVVAAAAVGVGPRQGVGINTALSARQPVAVVSANRVVACSALARAEGVRRGMRRREAQGRCPELAVFADDPVRDARVFEPVAVAVEELAVGIEVVRPGVIAVPARGPVGYFGGEEAAAERLVDHVSVATGVECQIGIADGLFAAVLAARRGFLIAPGASPDFLAPLDVRELNRPEEGHGPERAELVDLLRRMGLRTLGAFAAVPERDVASRFGTDAVFAHRLARGLQERPPSRRRPPPELSVTEVLDPPVDRVDAAAFVARTLAERLHAGLAAHGLACTRLRICAVTSQCEEHHRVWRCAEPLTPSGIADRVRWQLDGWLRGTDRPTAAVCLLRLEPEETVDGQALQLGLWQGGHGENDERAGRAMVHVQGLLGPDGVLTAVLGGGRGPADQVRLVPWGDEREPGADPVPPWPGRLPAPSPGTVLGVPAPAAVLDPDGAEVVVTDRYLLTGEPSLVAVNGGRPRQVLAWAGPWAADERWWEPDVSARRRAWLQILLDELEVSEEDGQTALLMVRENEQWLVEGVYD